MKMERKVCTFCYGNQVIAAGPWTTMSEAHDCPHCGGSGDEPFSVEELTIAARSFVPEVKGKDRDVAKRLLSAKMQEFGLTASEQETFSSVVWQRYDAPLRGPGWS